MIDQIINQQQALSETVNFLDSASQPVAPAMKCHCSIVLGHLSNQLKSLSDNVICNITDTNKTRGFLFHNSTSFSFTPPDRDLLTMLDTRDYVHAAQIIKATNRPNYRYARYPVKSNLKLDTRRYHLEEYPNNLLLQYLTYGFLLSINDSLTLNNTQIRNHFLALSYTKAAKQYLDKEIELGAIMGPFKKGRPARFPLFSLPYKAQR